MSRRNQNRSEKGVQLRIVVATALVIAAGLVATEDAAAAKPWPKNPRTVRIERAYHRTRAALAVARAQLAQAKQQLASVQNQLVQSQATASALQAKLDAIPSTPSPLAVAVEQVRREAEWAQGNQGALRGDLVA
jgi:hypothetical protein